MFHNSARDQGKSGRGTVEPRKRRRWRMRPTVVVLEDRRLLSTFTVTNNASSGAGSLPYEIGLANTAGGANTIVFGSFFNTPQTITLGGTQLELSTAHESVTITGPAAGVTVSGNGRAGCSRSNWVTASISGLTISGGTTTGDGGGLANFGTTTLNNCTVSGNSAYNGGGLSNDGTLTLTNCTVSGNSATATPSNFTKTGGGGLYNGGTLTMTNCTVSGNTARGVFTGGGVVNGTRYNLVPTLTLTNCTISANSGWEGGLLALGAPVTLTNTIVIANPGGDVYGYPLSGTNNLIGTVYYQSGLVNGVNGNRFYVTNALLAPLGNYGGPTQTMALLPGSPAINAGTSTGSPDDRPARPGPGRRRRHRRLREPGLYPHACRRQHSADGEHRHGVRQPARRERDGQQPGRAGERRCCHLRRQSREQWRLGCVVRHLGRHRQRPGRRHRRAQQHGWIVPGHGVSLGGAAGHLQSHEHRPGLRSPDREYDEPFSLPGSGPLEPA